MVVFLQLAQSEIHVWCVIWTHSLHTPLKWTPDFLRVQEITGKGTHVQIALAVGAHDPDTTPQRVDFAKCHVWVQSQQIRKTEECSHSF
jgi:hypothetical protein